MGNAWGSQKVPISSWTSFAPGSASVGETTPRPSIPASRGFWVLPTQALHALHCLKVAGELLPKPNRFETYYANNLWSNEALLRTVLNWHEFDEDLLSVVKGTTYAQARRPGTAHLTPLVLFNLATLEQEPRLRFHYQTLFERTYRSMQTDYNAMLHAMQESVGLSPSQLGLAFWSLYRYPTNREGLGDTYWKTQRKSLIKRYGGELLGKTREARPPDLRPRDMFLWQRSARSLRGDTEGWQYPPMDYLFAYWLARIATRALPPKT